MSTHKIFLRINFIIYNAFLSFYGLHGQNFEKKLGKRALRGTAERNVENRVDRKPLENRRGFDKYLGTWFQEITFRTHHIEENPGYLLR